MLGRILGSIFTNVKAWLVALGSGAVVALKDYVGSVDASDTDPFAMVIKVAIIAAIVKVLGAIVREASE